MKRKKGFLTQTLIMSIVPLVMAAIVFCVVSSMRMSSSLEESTYSQLKVAAEGLDMYYAWDIINQGEAAYEHDYVDNLKDKEIELTLFLDDTRYITSIIDASTGKRNEGTKADSTIYETVKKGNDYWADGIEIGGRKYYVYYTPVTDNSGKFLGMAFAGIPENYVSDEIKDAVTSLVIVTIVVIALACLVVVLLAIRMKKPIAEISNKTKELAAGNVNVDISVKSNVREFDTLIKAANELKDNLKNVITVVIDNANSLGLNVTDIKDGVDVSNKAAGDIVCAVDELAKGSMEMAESVQNTASSMHGIGEDIASISELAVSANESAKEVRLISGKAKSNLETLMGANKNTISISEDVINGINESSDAVSEIKKAADVISDIASQTNLLSLNASIEAARAGEAGKGFAVVAYSIQELADQSDKSAKEIQSIIENIVEKSEHNVILANQIKQAVDNEGGVLSEVSESFDDVNDRIGITADAVNEIKNKASDLDKESGKVLDEISTLSSISEENAASCEETTASMQELSANIETINSKTIDTKDIADSLLESVSYFKL